MRLSLVEALRSIKSGAAFRIANEARPGNMYLLNSILPEETRIGYAARAGNMVVRTTMAGMVGMDSPYPEGGFVELNEFEEQTVKLANRLEMPEKMLRDMHEMLRVIRDNALDQTGSLAAANSVSNQQAALMALNFVDKVIVQGHMDTLEWLRGQALCNGAINWTFNRKTLNVDYGIPPANIFPMRTGADGYGGTGSLWWQDYRAARKILRSLRAVIMQTDMLEMIIANQVNKILVTQQLDQGQGATTITRLVGTTERPSSDVRDQATLIPYDAQGEIIDPTDHTKTIRIPFIPDEKILLVGDYFVSGFTLAGINAIGQGSTPEPLLDNRLGYTHIGPTIEGDGQPGRWADVRTPDDKPWSLEGRGVTNGLPVIEVPDRIVVMSSELT